MVLSILFLASCKVYYKTADVDQSIQSSLNQVNGSLNNTLNQLKKLQGSFASIPCNAEEEPFLTALRLSTDVSLGQSELEGLQKAMNDAYQSFKDFSKGKEQITSGSVEWKQLKTTRKSIKMSVKVLKKKGQATVDKATEFNAYINANIVPKVQVCVPATYISQIKKQVPDPKNLTNELNSKLNQYAKNISEVETRFGSMHPKEIDTLKMEWNNLQSMTTQPQLVLKSANEAIAIFQAATVGIVQLYSCAPNWQLVKDVDAAMLAAADQLRSIQNNMQQGVIHMQQIIQRIQQ
jgi:hypothetical protein